MTFEQHRESTATLIDRIQGGEDAARDELFRRCLPLLRRFAHGRLPPSYRDLAETDDLVQVTLMRALGNLGRFEARGNGAFFAYLRQITLNAVREEIRKRATRGEETADLAAIPPTPDSVVEHVAGAETVAAYEAGLAQLAAPQREAVVLRIEFDMSYAEIAAELGSPSADAARMQVARGLRRLAELMP